MKKLLILVMTLALLSATAFAKPQTRTLVGNIADSQCGLSHAKMQEAGGMGDDDTACTLKGVEMGGKFVLADRVHKGVYALDEDSQATARELAGQKVKI